MVFFSSDGAGRVGESGTQGSAGERNLEVVVAISPGMRERGVPGSVERRARCGGPDKSRLGYQRSPGLVRDASEHDARVVYPVVFARHNDGDRNKREREGSAIAYF